MLDSEIRLPPEILENIFDYLDDEEIVRCSAVNTLWYSIARTHLARTTSLQLCRWPDTLPSNVVYACLAGDLSIKHFSKHRLKRLKTLKLWYDDPGPLPDGLLKQIFGCCKGLSRLDILNVHTIHKRNIESILEYCTPGLKLKLTLPRGDSIAHEVLNLLEEYRELFEEIVVEFAHSKRVIGWHPIFTCQTNFRLSQSSRTVMLTSPGLSHLECPQFCHVKSLTLQKCSCLSENALLMLSQVNLSTFSLDGYSARERTWISSFKTGFSNLVSFSSTNNQVVTEEALKALCNKNLQSLTLDFRKGPSETVGIPHLYKLFNLVNLKIIANTVAMNALLEGITHSWSKLRTLEIEECSLRNEDDIETIETLKSHLALEKNVKFVHKINCTKFQDNSIMKTGDW